jgi:hypothetical protein
MPKDTFEVGQYNNIMALTGGGANTGPMGMTSFETAQTAMNVSKPSPAISGPGGLS